MFVESIDSASVDVYIIEKAELTRLERHAVVSVGDHRVLDDDVVTAVRVPSIRVMGFEGSVESNVIINDIITFIDLHQR